MLIDHYDLVNLNPEIFNAVIVNLFDVFSPEVLFSMLDDLGLEKRAEKEGPCCWNCISKPCKIC